MSKLSYILSQCEDQEVPRGVSPNPRQTIWHDSTNLKVRYTISHNTRLCFKEPLKRVAISKYPQLINMYPICVSSKMGTWALVSVCILYSKNQVCTGNYPGSRAAAYQFKKQIYPPLEKFQAKQKSFVDAAVAVVVAATGNDLLVTLTKARPTHKHSQHSHSLFPYR